MKHRLILLVIATSSLVLVGFLVPLALLIRDTAADRAVAMASSELQSMAPLIAAADPAELPNVVERSNRDAAHPITVFLASGVAVGVPAHRSAAVDQAATGISLSADTAGGREVLVAVSGRSEGTAVIRTFIADDELHAGVGRSWFTLGLLGLGVLVVCVLVADRLARAMIRPLVSVAALSERLATGELDARAPLTGPREVRQVAVGLNRLARSILDLLAHERESAADLSHRLRTPLTALRIDAEALRDPDERHRVSRDLDRLENAVDEIIRLARRPPLATTQRPSCDATRIVRERVEFWSPLADEEQRALSYTAPPASVYVGLDDDSLSVCLDALLGNVFAHTPEGTAMRVELIADRVSGGAQVIVADRGPGGVMPTQLARGASGAGSTGLGLDIVRRTAAAAGGSVDIRSNGSGTSVTVTLGPPLAVSARRDVRRRRTRT